jgi:large subunit ribosomal protein L24
MAARILQGDTVVVISGKDKGKTGKVTRVIADSDKVIVEGINVAKRHTKPSPRNEQGGILDKEMPLHACKVMPVDPKTGKGTRVSFKTDDNGKKVRVAKSGEALPNAAAAKKAKAEG